MQTPAGAVGGDLVLDAWGSRHQRLEVRVPGMAPLRIVKSGDRLAASGPADLLTLLLGGGTDPGCALLPQTTWLADRGTPAVAALPGTSASEFRLLRDARVKAPAAGLLFTLDPSTGDIARLAYTGRGHRRAEVRYSSYRNNREIRFAAHIEQDLDGVRQWTVDLKAIELRPGMGESDFALSGGSQ